MAAKEKKEGEVVNESKAVLSNLLKTNKEDHYNFEDTIYYKVPSSSMLMNVDMEGGLEPGAHRFIGAPSGGKTSAALDFLFNFLKGGDGKERRGMYFRCEGKLSPKIQKRSGVKFVENVEEWEDGTCIIIDSNIFEFVFQTVRDLLRYNKSKCKYFFIMDSLDMMIKKEDAEKPFGIAGQVAGGALLTSVFFKTVSIALAKRGHITILISQLRDTININPREKTTVKQGQSSGGHAVEHAAGWVLDFQPRYSDDIIREDDEKYGRPIGHKAKCLIVKADNESYLRLIKYPIKYGRTNGTSIWVEKEVLDLLKAYKFVYRPEDKGQMYFFSEEIHAELVESMGTEVPEKFRGIKAVDEWLEKNPTAIEYLTQKFLNNPESFEVLKTELPE